MTLTTRALALAAGLLLGAVGLAVAQPAPVTVPTAGGDVTVLADRIEDLGRDNVVVATGNVEVVRGRARLNADRVEINRETGDAVATGRVVFYDGEDRLTGDRIDYNIKTGTGVVHHGRASTAPYYRLGGESMERVGDSVYRVRRGFFTTCEDDPPAWSFRFSEATADLEDYVFGTGASFWVKNIPLIPFFPFFAAAIRRERQSGFLFPTFGTSSRRGFYADIPFYWAINESHDLTVAFDAYELKGFGGRVQYRYRLSEDAGGTFNGFYVHESKVNDDDRGWVHFQRDLGSEGGRVDLHPRFSAPVRPGDLFTVTPFIGGRLTGYDETAVRRRLSTDFVNQIDVVNDEARLRRLVEAGGDIEMPISGVYAFDRWGVDALLHRIEPRVNYTFITGTDLNHLPFYTERVDRIRDTSQLTYSVTNRILARTASGPDAETVRWEAVRLVLGHSIDLRRQNNALGDVIGDLIVQAPSIFRFRAEGTYNLATSDLVTATTDLSARVSGVTGAVGTRYDAQQRTNFLQATLRAELTERLVVQGSTNWDLRTDTFVENQFGIDLRFQCYEFSVVFIDRSRELRRNGADQEVRFSVNLLGVGGPIRTTVGP